VTEDRGSRTEDRGCEGEKWEQWESRRIGDGSLLKKGGAIGEERSTPGVLWTECCRRWRKGCCKRCDLDNASRGKQPPEAWPVEGLQLVFRPGPPMGAGMHVYQTGNRVATGKLSGHRWGKLTLVSRDQTGPWTSHLCRESGLRLWSETRSPLFSRYRHQSKTGT
jgi:hypothetical protein